MRQCLGTSPESPRWPDGRLLQYLGDSGVQVLHEPAATPGCSKFSAPTSLDRSSAFAARYCSAALLQHRLGPSHTSTSEGLTPYSKQHRDTRPKLCKHHPVESLPESDPVVRHARAIWLLLSNQKQGQDLPSSCCEEYRVGIAQQRPLAQQLSKLSCMIGSSSVELHPRAAALYQPVPVIAYNHAQLPASTIRRQLMSLSVYRTSPPQ